MTVSKPISGAPDAHHADAQACPAWLGWLQAPFFAVQFLTILPPTLVRRAPAAADFGRSDTFFPLVGVLLGSILAGADLALAPYVAEAVRNVLAVALLAILTGGLHLDGLIDTCDGLFAGPDAERRLAIMRDPRAGSFGVIGVVLVLGLKVAALGSVPPALRPLALVLAPCLGRWGIVLATGCFPYARPVGMGRAFKDSIRPLHVMGAGIIAAGASVGLLGGGGIVLWLAVGVGVLVLCAQVTRRLGGVTGDVYGALCELSETAVLLALGLRGVWFSG